MLHVSFRDGCSNVEVRLGTVGNPSSDDVRVRRLRLFEHLARVEPSTDRTHTSSALSHMRTTEGLEAFIWKTRDNVDTDSRVRPSACECRPVMPG